ncbi:MAG: amidase [Caulobacteraceae bacterium]
MSPVDLTKRMLARIAKVDPMLKSYATVMGDQAMADARAAAAEIAAGRYRGPLHGIPIAIKDLCWTKGVRTMGGLAVRRNFIPTDDATVVKRLRGAGAVVLGKTNLSEGAAAGYNPAMDVPLNPWNHDRWPGMSSSGSGVAVAAGTVLRSRGHRHWRFDPQSLIRQRCSRAEADLRPRQPVRRDADGALARPCGRDGAGGGRRRHPVRRHGGPRPADPTCLAVPPAETVKALGAGVRGLRDRPGPRLRPRADGPRPGAGDRGGADGAGTPGRGDHAGAHAGRLSRHAELADPVQCGNGRRPRRDLSVARVRIWTLSSRVPRLGPLRHAQGPRTMRAAIART